MSYKGELNLWGIETVRFQILKLFSLAWVNWTCEGLKRFLNNSITLTWNLCELNLWGIETDFEDNLYKFLT